MRLPVMRTYFSFLFYFCVLLASIGQGVTCDDVQVEMVVQSDGSILKNDDVQAVAVEEDGGDINPKPVWNLNQVMNTIDILQKELEEVQHMIQLQDKKLTLLEQIRQEQNLFSSTKTPADIRTISLKKDIERQLEKLEDEDVKSSNIIQSAGEFDNFFIEKASMVASEKDSIVDAKIASIPDTSVAELVAVAHKNGSIHFYIAPLLDQKHLLLSYDTKHQPISILLELENTSEPYLIVTFQDAHIGVYGLDLTREPLHGRFSLKVTSGHLFTLAKVPQKTLLLTRGKHKKAALSLAYPNGKISFLALNGTLRYEYQVEGGAVDAMAHYRNLFAVANGSHTLVQYMAKGKEKQFHSCSGIFRTNVTSIIFDPSQHGILYAGTAQGDILAYLLRFSGDQQDVAGGGTTCRLLYRAKIHQRVPVVLNVFKGYLLAGTPSQLHVFNISRPYENSLSLNFLFTSKAPSTAAIGHFAFDMTAGPFVSSALHLTSDGSRVVLYQNLLPVQEPSNDPAWMRFGYFIALIIVAAISQMYFRSRGSTSGPPPTAGDPFELFRRHAANGSFGPQAAKGMGGSGPYTSQSGFNVDRIEGLSDELRRQLERSTY